MKNGLYKYNFQAYHLGHDSYEKSCIVNNQKFQYVYPNHMESVPENQLHHNLPARVEQITCKPTGSTHFPTAPHWINPRMGAKLPSITNLMMGKRSRLMMELWANVNTDSKGRWVPQVSTGNGNLSRILPSCETMACELLRIKGTNSNVCKILSGLTMFMMQVDFLDDNTVRIQDLVFPSIRSGSHCVHSKRFEYTYNTIYSMIKKTGVSFICVLMALHLMCKFRQKKPTDSFQHMREFKILVTSMILSNKLLDDKAYTNKSWATLTGISNCKINELEREFLSVMDFNLVVKEMEFYIWIRQVESIWENHEHLPVNKKIAILR